MKNKKPKLCFAASSGGHLDELLMLRPLMERYDSIVVTEKTAFKTAIEGIKCYYLIVNSFLSLKICLLERPDVVISTGVLATIPLCILCKVFGKRLIYIESFAKVTSPTRTGNLLYRFADRFYVQWPELLEGYPDAVYRGGIY